MSKVFTPTPKKDRQFSRSRVYVQPTMFLMMKVSKNKDEELRPLRNPF